MNFAYASCLYKIYQKELSKTMEDIVRKMCDIMTKMPHIGYNNVDEVDSSQPMTIGTTLFELYLYLQRFVV